MKELFKPNLESEDTFFVSYEQLVIYFDVVNICQTEYFHEIKTNGKFNISGLSHLIREGNKNQNTSGIGKMLWLFYIECFLKPKIEYGNDEDI